MFGQLQQSGFEIVDQNNNFKADNNDPAPEQQDKQHDLGLVEESQPVAVDQTVLDPGQL